MSTGDISLDSVLPSEYEMPTHVSTSQNILRKQRMRFLPNAQISYSPDANPIIEFEVQDPSSFLLLPESEFVFDIYRSDTQSTYNHKAFFDVGGIHAAIKNFEVYSRSSNTRIHQMQGYNRFYAITRANHMERSSLDMFGAMQGDSLDYYDACWRRYTWNTTTLANCVTVNARTNTYSAEFVFTIPDPKLGLYISVDDTIMIRNKKGAVLLCGVNGAQTTGSNTILTLSCPNLNLDKLNAATNEAEGLVSIDSYLEGLLGSQSIIIYKLQDDPATIEYNRAGEVSVHDPSWKYFPHYVPERYRVLAINNSDFKQRVLWKPMSSFWTKNWPLLTIKMGFRFRIELERGGRCINTGLNPVSSSVEPNYTITNPRFVGMLSAPDGSIVKNIVAQWNSPMGLLYYCPTYKYRESNQASNSDTNTTLNFHYGVRSAKGFAMVIQDNDVTNGNTGLQYASNSISQFLRDGVTSYQIQFGAQQYPIEAVDMTQANKTDRVDYLTFENQLDLYYWSFVKEPIMTKNKYREANKVWGVNGNQVAANSTYRWERNDDGTYDATQVSCFNKGFVAEEFVLYRDFSRSLTEDNLLCGMDVSMAPLQVNLYRGLKHSDYGFAGNVVYRSYLFHDAFIRIGSQITTSLE